MAILLLSTEACHLCEMAQQVLVQAFDQSKMQALVKQHQIDVYMQDIIDQPKWLELYGEKIPVLFDEDTGSTLEWPFDLNTTVSWFEKLYSVTGSESR